MKWEVSHLKEKINELETNKKNGVLGKHTEA